MDIEKEKMFVNRYIIKNKRERILYELNKPSKRLDALSRFCHDYYTYVDERKIIYRGKEITDKQLKEIVKRDGNENKGYMICWNQRYDATNMSVESAISAIRCDGMCMIFISGDICIISTEQIEGAKEIVVLHDIK